MKGSTQDFGKVVGLMKAHDGLRDEIYSAGKVNNAKAVEYFTEVAENGHSEARVFVALKFPL